MTTNAIGRRELLATGAALAVAAASGSPGRPLCRRRRGRRGAAGVIVVGI
jgi:hypothetical protein